MAVPGSTAIVYTAEAESADGRLARLEAIDLRTRQRQTLPAGYGGPDALLGTQVLNWIDELSQRRK